MASFVVFGLLSLAQLLTAAPNAATVQTCSELSTALPGKVKLPGDADYNKENRDYYHVGLADLKPACVVLPSDAQNVADIVKILNKQPDVKFAVKGGGHSPNPGHSSIHEGVLVAMRNNIGTHLDKANGVAHVKSGGHWWDVYKALNGTGMSVVGGRLGTIGIGGFLTQGGLSFLSGEYGLAADNILEYEIVLANGTIAKVSQKSHPDLVEAMRGAGSQFGIVTKFTLRAVPVDKIYVGLRLYSATRDQYYEALQEFIANIGNFAKADTLLALGLPSLPGLPSFLGGRLQQREVAPPLQPNPNFDPQDTNTMLLRLFAGYDLFGYGRLVQAVNATTSVSAEQAQQKRTYLVPVLNRGGKPANEVFGSKFNLLPLVTEIGGEVDYSTAVGITDPIWQYWPFRTGFRTFTLPVQRNNPKLLADMEDISTELSNTYSKQLKGFGSIGIIVEPFPRSFGKAAESNGNNAMNLKGNDNDRIVLEIESLYTNKADDEIMLTWSRAFADRLTKYLADFKARTGGVNATMPDYNPLFMNDASFDQDVAKSYRNVGKYSALQKQLDPNGLFSSRCGGFKFPKA